MRIPTSKHTIASSTSGHSPGANLKRQSFEEVDGTMSASGGSSGIGGESGAGASGGNDTSSNNTSPAASTGKSEAGDSRSKSELFICLNRKRVSARKCWSPNTCLSAGRSRTASLGHAGRGRRGGGHGTTAGHAGGPGLPPSPGGSAGTQDAQPDPEQEHGAHHHESGPAAPGRTPGNRGRVPPAPGGD